MSRRLIWAYHGTSPLRQAHPSDEPASAARTRDRDGPSTGPSARTSWLGILSVACIEKTVNHVTDVAAFDVLDVVTEPVSPRTETALNPESHGPFGYVALVREDSTRQVPRRGQPNEEFSILLADWLTFMVPLFVAELRHTTDEEIQRARADALEQIASHGDDLQYGGRHQGSSRTALAKALAILARAEGGVTVLGVHACLAPHVDCPGRPLPSITDHPRRGLCPSFSELQEGAREQ